MHVIVTDASLMKGVCGIGVVLVNEYGHEVARHQEMIKEDQPWKAELKAIEIGIKKFGHISTLVYNDCKKAVQEAQSPAHGWRTSGHQIKWLPPHLKGLYLHFVAHELSVMARKLKTGK